MNFEKAKNSYRKNAFIQEQMAKNLISVLINYQGGNFDKIFEIGSGTGFLTDEISNRLKFKKLVLNDLTENFTKYDFEFIKGDILEIETKEKFDLIASNAVFQWIFDYDSLFSKLHSMLEARQTVVFSYFGKENFSQIKNITGFGLEYPRLDDFIIKNGFKILYFEEELKTVCFKDAYELLSHIKYTGVKVKNKIWTKTDFKNFEEKYFEKYKGDFGLEVTYHPVYYVISSV